MSGYDGPVLGLCQVILTQFLVLLSASWVAATSHTPLSHHTPYITGKHPSINQMPPADTIKDNQRVHKQCQYLAVTLPRKAKRKYLLPLRVSRYCLLALQRKLFYSINWIKKLGDFNSYLKLNMKKCLYILARPKIKSQDKKPKMTWKHMV